MNIFKYLDFSLNEKKVFIPFLLLIFFGLLMVYSASYFYAKEIYGDGSYLLKKQLLFFALGLIPILTLRNMNTCMFLRYTLYINIFLVCLMIATLIPGLTPKLKGAHRWLKVGPLQIQPGEFIKFTIGPLFFNLLIHFKTYTPYKKYLTLLVVMMPAGIFFLQPDFGGLVIYSLVLTFVAFLSPISRKIFYSSFAGIILAGSYLVVQMPYRVQRLLTFLDPWKDPQNSGFQIIQSYLALAHGHLWGKGLGNSKEKLFYLPEAHNDFIFSVIGEELGLVGVFGVMFIFSLFFAFGPKIIKHINIFHHMDAYIYTATIYFVIGLQVVLNLGVVFGLLPTKGLNLPFISYGGSSMVSNCLGIGLLLGLIRQYSKE